MKLFFEKLRRGHSMSKQQMTPTRPSQILLKLHQNGFFDE